MASILVIDDKRTIREMLREALEDAGYKVSDAPNGLEGLRLHKASPADLIICDIFMPEKDGMSTIRDLRQHHPRLPIIAISGGDKSLAPPDSYLSLAERFGADAALSKPFKIEELLGIVKRLLAR